MRISWPEEINRGFGISPFRPHDLLRDACAQDEEPVAEFSFPTRYRSCGEGANRGALDEGSAALQSGFQRASEEGDRLEDGLESFAGFFRAPKMQEARKEEAGPFQWIGVEKSRH